MQESRHEASTEAERFYTLVCARMKQFLQFIIEKYRFISAWKFYAAFDFYLRTRLRDF